ncbi:MAG TPA: SGNH/GDSL hydrolase family protein [Actinophytocola sp.]|jgi:lysophospholipase L1-like esterase|uniref:SGNH/GDSL hydrolase family protein n=1 Tax=Actinophytocola sp. TaxID=1872138 RepID=UPI002F94AB8F
MSYRRYVAIGDSCAEGLDDPYPDGRGFRGFADLTATRLAEVEPDLHYANLAVRGRRLDQILAEQVPVATRLRPDLVTLFGGGNDVLQGRITGLAANLDAIAGAFAGIARTTVLFTLPDLARRLPGMSWLRPRVDVLNELIIATAARHGTLLVDVREDPWAEDIRLYGADRLHLGELGHHRVAGHLLTALGVSPGDWLAPLPSAVREPVWRAVVRQWNWVRHHVTPAVHGAVRNKLIGRQPGDGFVAKRPELARLIDR